jgi:hypothetical protein
MQRSPRNGESDGSATQTSKGLVCDCGQQDREREKHLPLERLALMAQQFAERSIPKIARNTGMRFFSIADPENWDLTLPLPADGLGLRLPA